jgi:hypothetical protein
VILSNIINSEQLLFNKNQNPMKVKFFRSTLKFVIVAFMASVALVACKKDDNKPNDPIVLDGIYIKTATATLADLDTKVRMTVAKNEVVQTDRNALVEIYMALEASNGFSLYEVAGSVKSTYGPSADFALIETAALNVDEPKNGLWKGGYEASTTLFTVPEDGLYHIVIDTELKKVAIARVKWGLIGGATPGGWSNDTPMTETFTTSKVEFSVVDVTMLVNEFKFRYSGGWKIILDTEYDLGGGQKGVKVNTNFGGAVGALVAGGANIANAEYAVYKFTVTWELGVGTTATMVKTGEAIPLPTYPAALYMIGNSVGTWDWALTDLPMIPVNSHPNAFWRIVWMDAAAADPGIKFAPGKEWVGDFGVADNTNPGVKDYLKGGNNLMPPTTSGYYMVWIDLERDSISVAEAEVYLIGDAVGAWDAAVPANKFTVDNTNEVITITKDLSAANLRMNAWHKWHYDWWQHEFNIIGGNIEYRGTGGDQVAVPVTAGSAVISLNFKTGTGTIVQ